MRDSLRRMWCVLLACSIAATVAAATVHPVEAKLRRAFPSIALDTVATFSPSAAGLHANVTGRARPSLHRA